MYSYQKFRRYRSAWDRFQIINSLQLSFFRYNKSIFFFFCKVVNDMLPKDPMILLSYINTKLRDDYASLDELCDDLQVERSDIENTLSAIDYRYHAELNKFI